MNGPGRDRLLLAGRAGFVALTVLLAWWGFRGRWDEVAEALGRTGPGHLAGSIALTALGLLVTALLWRRLVLGLGPSVGRRDAAAIFLVGQLGKYIPGSVWSFAAQARLGREHRVPGRSSVAASSVFLLLHTLTGIVLGATLAAVGVLPADGPRWLWGLLAVVGAAGLAPPVVRLLGARVAGRDVTARFTTADLGVAVVAMAAVWLAYGAAVRLLLGTADGADLVCTVGAFALSHAAGVLLVLAPAGLGAREGVLVALLAPTVGVAPAAAAALLARLVHTVADFGAAALAWALARTPAPTPVPQREGAA